jgi:ribosome-associated heat shock protein Hsp15
VAQTLYLESEESKDARRKAAEERKASPHFDDPGRPTKRNRRDLNRLLHGFRN